MLPNFNDLIRDFHNILECEYTAVSISDPMQLQNLTELCTKLPADNLTTGETTDILLKKYNSDSGFHRIWSSASLMFEFTLKAKHNFSQTELAQYVRDLIIRSNQPDSRMTSPEHYTQRYDSKGINGSTLTHPNDFWLICFYLYRLTIQYSNIYDAALKNAQDAISRPVPPPKAPRVPRPVTSA